MILECPACGTRYLINDNALGAEGREVRCAKCAHEWYQARPKEPEISSIIAAPPTPAPATISQAEPEIDLSAFESQEERPRPIPEGSGLPVPYSRRNASGSLKAACFASLAASLILGVFVFRAELVERAPFLQPLYNSAGYYSTKGIGFTTANFNRSEDGKSFEFDCSLANTADTERKTPVLRISLRNSEKEVINSIRKDIPLELKAMMKPAQSILCGKQSFSFNAKNAAYLAVELGSPMDLSKRK